MKFAPTATFFLFVSLISIINGKKADISACTRCQNDNSCRPPDCFCCRDELNLPMSEADIPQIVFFTFDDALTSRAADFYNQLFNVTDRKNPNGCPVSMTMFISHQDTKYNKVSEFYQKGMEIAAHSVTHEHMTPENFLQEAKTQKSNLAKLGGVPENEILGWRSPFLEPIGDMQPDKLKELGYLYDATLTFSKRNLYDKSPTPFTLDFGWPYDCKVKPCPRRRHFGFWEVPVVSLLDYKHKYDCVYVDGCNNPPPDESSAYKFLMDNFNSYYTRSKVPFGINMHPSWFYTPHRLIAMDRFIQTLLKMDDVYIVSVDKMIKWLKDPTPLSRLKDFQPWSCPSVKPHSHTGSSGQHKGRNTFNFKSTLFNRHRLNGHPGAPRMSREEMQRRHIQARLRQIAQMRAQITIDRERQLMQVKHHNEAKEKWWSRASTRRSSADFQNRSNGHQHASYETKKSHTRSNHSKHSRHEKPIPKFQFSSSRGKERKTVPKTSKPKNPFWQGKSKSSKSPIPAYKSNSAWWNKPVPKINNVKKFAMPVTIESPNTTPRPIIVSKQKPTVNFSQQLKEQEKQRQRIIEQQRVRQQEQLRQMKKELQRNEKLAIEKQQEEERKRLEARLNRGRVGSESGSGSQLSTSGKEKSSMVQPNPVNSSTNSDRTFDPWQQFVKHLMGQRNGT